MGRLAKDLRIHGESWGPGGRGYLFPSFLHGERGEGYDFLPISARMLLIVFDLRHAISVKFCVF